MALQVTIETMIIFFAFLALGFASGKIGVIKSEGMGQISQIITKIFLPILIFYSTTTSVTLDLIRENAILLPISIAIYAVLAAFAFVVAKLMRIEHDKDRVFQLSFIFGNTGFVGFPLLSSVFHETGVLFMCLFSIADQLLFWTYGIWLSTQRDSAQAGFSLRMLLSPNIIAIVLAMAFALSGLSLPDLLGNILGTASKATSPLCMIYLGALVCFSSIGSTVKRADAYVLIAMKMVVLPICAGLLASSLGLAADVVGCIALYIALPVMTVVPMICEQNGSEGSYATGIAVMTFIACIATIPLVALMVF